MNFWHKEVGGILGAILVSSTGTPVIAGESQRGWSEERTCFKTEYREEYIPGTENNPGYVKSWKDTVEVPCENESRRWRRHSNVPNRHNTTPVPMPSYQRHVTIHENVDTNDCSDGTVAGALLGGGLAGFGSRGKDRWWAIPGGIIGGAMLGCSIDGG